MAQDILEVMKSIQTSSALSEQVFSAIFGFLIAAGGAAMWIRKKLSKDSLEIKKDTAEGDLIQHLEDERDMLKAEKDRILERLLVVDRERQDAVGMVGRLSVQVKLLTKQVDHLEDMVVNLGQKLDTATTKMQEYAIENAKLTVMISNTRFHDQKSTDQ